MSRLVKKVLHSFSREKLPLTEKSFVPLPTLKIPTSPLTGDPVTLAIISYYHFAHSYVQGHWKAEDTSAPIVLTKSSHDIDIFCKWLWPLVPSKVSIFTGLGHFRKERKPEGTEGVTWCLECPEDIEAQCEYSMKKECILIHSPLFHLS